MDTCLYVSGESSQQRMPLPATLNAELAQVFPWTASSAEDEGLILTNELLSEPGELEAIMDAWAEVERGEYVEGVEAVRALRPRE